MHSNLLAHIFARANQIDFFENYFGIQNKFVLFFQINNFKSINTRFFKFTILNGFRSIRIENSTYKF